MVFRKHSHAFVCAILVIIFIFGGCSPVHAPSETGDSTDTASVSVMTTQNNTTTPQSPETVTSSDIINPDGADYSLITRDGLHYIVLENEYAVSNGSQVSTNIHFSSMKEFKDTVTLGKLSDSQKEIVSTFKKDENGILTCDFNNLYIPALPQNGIYSDISWEGEGYSFYIDLEGEPFGFFHLNSKENHDRNYKYDITDFFDRDTITLNRTEDLGNEKTAFYYTTQAGYYVRLRYSLKDGDRTYQVDKTYRLNDSEESIDEATAIPQRISMYCSQDEVYYSIKLHEFDGVPTDEWLLQIGIQKYVESSHVVK